MRRHFSMWPYVTTAALALSFSLPATAANTDHTPKITTETVMSDLESPWDMAFLPDGTMFYTEKGSYILDKSFLVSYLFHRRRGQWISQTKFSTT